MEIGGHIGLSRKRWNPKMRPYIYVKRYNPNPRDERRRDYFPPQYDVFNIPLVQTRLREAFDFLYQTAQAGGVILFVGTKTRQVQELIRQIAARTGVNYVYQRWLGGTLTNFKTINNSIRQLNLLNERREQGLSQYTKKEQIGINKKAIKLEKFFGGIKTMRGLPNVIVVDDPYHEKNAVTEAKKLGIAVVGIANTNADPTLLDYIVPANNASIRSITLYLNLLADAVAMAQGKAPLFAFKTDEEINIPAPPRRERSSSETRTVVSRRNSFASVDRRREAAAATNPAPAAASVSTHDAVSAAPATPSTTSNHA